MYFMLLNLIIDLQFSQLNRISKLNIQVCHYQCHIIIPDEYLMVYIIYYLFLIYLQI